MELRQLEYFRAIVDAGTINRGGTGAAYDTAAVKLSDQNAGGRASGCLFSSAAKRNHPDRGREKHCMNRQERF